MSDRYEIELFLEVHDGGERWYATVETPYEDAETESFDQPQQALLAATEIIKLMVEEDWEPPTRKVGPVGSQGCCG